MGQLHDFVCYCADDDDYYCYWLFVIAIPVLRAKGLQMFERGKKVTLYCGITVNFSARLINVNLVNDAEVNYPMLKQICVTSGYWCSATLVSVCSVFCYFVFTILYVNCFGRTMLYMCVEYHI